MQPNSAAIEPIAAHFEVYSLCCSKIIRTARSWSSTEYRLLCFLVPVCQELEPPTVPGDSDLWAAKFHIKFTLAIFCGISKRYHNRPDRYRVERCLTT